MDGALHGHIERVRDKEQRLRGLVEATARTFDSQYHNEDHFTPQSFVSSRAQRHDFRQREGFAQPPHEEDGLDPFEMGAMGGQELPPGWAEDAITPTLGLGRDDLQPPAYPAFSLAAPSAKERRRKIEVSYNYEEDSEGEGLSNQINLRKKVRLVQDKLHGKVTKPLLFRPQPPPLPKLLPKLPQQGTSGALTIPKDGHEGLLYHQACAAWTPEASTALLRELVSLWGQPPGTARQHPSPAMQTLFRRLEALKDPHSGFLDVRLALMARLNGTFYGESLSASDQTMISDFLMATHATTLGENPVTPEKDGAGELRAFSNRFVAALGAGTAGLTAPASGVGPDRAAYFGGAYSQERYTPTRSSFPINHTIIKRLNGF